MSSSQLNTSSLDFNDDDFAKFSADAVFFVLVQERKRIPIKKADIMKVTNICDIYKLTLYGFIELGPRPFGMKIHCHPYLNLGNQFDRKAAGSTRPSYD